MADAESVEADELQTILKNLASCVDVCTGIERFNRMANFNVVRDQSLSGCSPAQYFFHFGKFSVAEILDSKCHTDADNRQHECNLAASCNTTRLRRAKI